MIMRKKIVLFVEKRRPDLEEVNDYIHKNNSKSKATSNIKFLRILSSLSSNDVGLYLRDGAMDIKIGVVNLQSHWVAYIDEIFFDSFGCGPPNKLSRFFVKRNRYCLIEYEIQSLTIERVSYCAAFCLYIIHSTKVIRLDLKSPILKLYYQTIS